MCRPSTLAPDWVTKGCHIVVRGIELTVSPDHVGGVVFRPFFSGTAKQRANDAVKVAIEKCLQDAKVRRQWIRTIDSAIALMAGQDGDLKDLALGRMAEFKFLIVALKRHEN